MRKFRDFQEPSVNVDLFMLRGEISSGRGKGDFLIDAEYISPI